MQSLVEWSWETTFRKETANLVRKDCTAKRGSNQLKELVRGSVEETLNGLPDVGAEKLTRAARYEREVRLSRGTAAVTTAVISPQLRGMSP